MLIMKKIAYFFLSQQYVSIQKKQSGANFADYTTIDLDITLLFY